MNFAKIVIFLLLLQPMCSLAFFPPAGENTPREMLDYRRRKKIEYKTAQEDHEKQMIVSRIQVEKAFATSPWKMRAGQMSLSQIPSPPVETPWQKIERHLAVFSLLTLIPVLAIAFVLLRKTIRSDRFG